MICQVCGAQNDEEAEFCWRCRSHLLILSGQDQATDFFGDVPLEEHLLERISALEDKVLGMEKILITILRSVRTQDQSLLVEQAGLQAIREILEDQGILEGERFVQCWEDRLNLHYLSREKAERIEDSRGAILAQTSLSTPQDLADLMQQSVLNFQFLDPAAGYELLSRAHDLDPGNAELTALLGELLILEDEYESARGYLTAALQADPAHYNSKFFLALVHFNAEEYRQAKLLMEECLTASPTPYLAHFTLGMIHYHVKEFEKAAEHFEESVHSRPLPLSLMMLATVRYEMDQASRAIEPLEEVLREEEDNENAHFLLGLCYLEKNWNRKAEAQFRQALRLNPARLDYQQALQMTKVWKKLPGIPESSISGALCREAEEDLHQGKVSSSLTRYRKAYDLEPENASIGTGYAAAALEAGQYNLAARLCFRILEKNLPEVLAATVYSILLVALKSQEKHQEAVRFAREMARRCRMDYAQTISHLEIAFNLAQLGRSLEEAYVRAKEALEDAPDVLVGECHDVLGWVAFKLGKLKEAHGNLLKSVKIQPHTQNLLRLGMVCLQLGYREEARESFREARNTKMNDTDLHRILWQQLNSGLRRKAR